MTDASATTRVRSALAAATMAAMAAVASIACVPPGPIVIGLSASLSGTDYLLGAEGRDTAELFLRETNASGGIAGRKILLEVRDLASDRGNVYRMDTELAAAGAVAIVGHYTSLSAAVAMDFADTARVPVISPAATSESLSGRDDFFFRTVMTSAADPLILAGLMADSGASSILVIATSLNSPYVDMYLEGLKSRIAVAAEIHYGKLTDIDYESVGRVYAGGRGYQAVMIVASPLDTGYIAQQLGKRGLLPALYVSGWAGTEDLILYGGSAVEGAVFVHQIDERAPEASTFTALYRSVYGKDPSYAAIETWDSFVFLKLGLEASMKENIPLQAALKQIESFPGLTGPIVMDAFGDAARTVFIKRVANGRIVVTGKAQ